MVLEHSEVLAEDKLACSKPLVLVRNKELVLEPVHSKEPVLEPVCSKELVQVCSKELERVPVHSKELVLEPVHSKELVLEPVHSKELAGGKLACSKILELVHNKVLELGNVSFACKRKAACELACSKLGQVRRNVSRD